jgi:hypothetical protein
MAGYIINARRIDVIVSALFMRDLARVVYRPDIYGRALYVVRSKIARYYYNFFPPRFMAVCGPFVAHAR